MTQPALGVPAWHADPSGRHELRWWDGAAFTDQVADAGAVSTDAGPPTAPAPPPAPAAPAEPSASRSKGPLVLVVAGIAALGAGAFIVLRDGGGTSGTGRFEGTIGEDAAIGVHAVGLAARSALTVEVEPSSDLDAVVAFVLAEEDADRIAELYEDLAVTSVDDLGDAFGAVDRDELDALGDDQRVLFRTDVGFAGDDEQLVLAVPFDVDLQVVIAPFDEEDAEGDYDVTIEAFGLDVDEDADGEELLEAVADDDEVPDSFADLAEELLELG